jgi:hypothetical protein
MAATPDHGKLDITLQGIHKPYQWSFANDAARVAAGSYVAADVGKFAIQTDLYSVWCLTATTPTWQFISMGIVPRVCVRRTTGQVIATGTSVAVTFTAEDFDTDTMFAATDSKLYAKHAGIYIAQGSMQWDGASGGNYRYNYILKNGAGSNHGAAGLPDDATGLAQRPGHVISEPIAMAVNDYMELIALHDFGSDRNVDNGIFSMYAIALT